MGTLYSWIAIVALVLESTAGDILMARAMKNIGDLGEVRHHSGLWYTVKTVLTNTTMLFGVFFMALGYFTLLFALSWSDVSLVVPASASLTFISTTMAAKIFLHEDVDRRRVAAALLVAGGVAILAA